MLWKKECRGFHGLCSTYAADVRYAGFCRLDKVCAICSCSCSHEYSDPCPRDGANDIDSDSICAVVDSCATPTVTLAKTVYVPTKRFVRRMASMMRISDSVCSWLNKI